MPEGYEVRHTGGAWGNFHRSLRISTGILNRRLKTIKGPYHVHQPDGDWSGDLTRREVRDRVTRRLEHAEIGERVKVCGSEPVKPCYVIRKFFRSSGSVILDEALSQLGVLYVWADEDPKGGGTSGFDCSGLTKWCLAQVGVDIPHQSELQRLASVPCSWADARPGELAFYGEGGAPQGPAGHVAIKYDDTRIIDTASAAHPVSMRHVTDVWIGKMPFICGYFPDVTRPT